MNIRSRVEVDTYNIVASFIYITVNGQLFCAVYLYILQLNVANYSGCWMIVNRYLDKICFCLGGNLKSWGGGGGGGGGNSQRP